MGRGAFGEFFGDEVVEVWGVGLANQKLWLNTCEIQPCGVVAKVLYLRRSRGDHFLGHERCPKYATRRLPWGHG